VSDDQRETALKRSAALLVAFAAVGALAIAPTTSGAEKVAPGSVYKGKYRWDGTRDKFRIKVFESGNGGRFTLRCAGVVQQKFHIRRDEFKIELGATELLVQGKGEFGRKGRVRGEISKIDTEGAECRANGKFAGTIVDG
jgi:hypothetical protein